MDLQNRWVCWRKGSTKPWDRRSSGFLTLDQIEPGRTFFFYHPLPSTDGWWLYSSTVCRDVEARRKTPSSLQEVTVETLTPIEASDPARRNWCQDFDMTADACGRGS